MNQQASLPSTRWHARLWKQKSWFIHMSPSKVSGSILESAARWLGKTLSSPTLSVLVIMKGWNDKQTFLCVSGRRREKERMAIAFNEERGRGKRVCFVPTPKEFSKNEGNDERERRGRRKVLPERNTLFVFHRALPLSSSSCRPTDPALVLKAWQRGEKRRRSGGGSFASFWTTL